MFCIQSLRVDYQNVTAVHDLSLELQAGTIYGLVGPNGAGKTSTIKAIAGIIEPTYGVITIDGFDTQTRRFEALKRLGYMPDFAPVYENLKVWEYLDVFGAAYQMPVSERKEKIDYWLARVDLKMKAEEFIRTLSRGMRQRLVLAKTLLSDPSLILLDEPASGLDPISRMDLRNILKDVASQGKTIIISSHVLTELSEFCNAIGVMEKGRLVVSGSMEEIRRKMGSANRLVIKGQDRGEADKIVQFLQEKRLEVLPSGAGDNAEIAVIFDGNGQAAAQLLREMVTAGILVSEFYPEQDTMEDIFFKIGAKEAS